MYYANVRPFHKNNANELLICRKLGYHLTPSADNVYGVAK